MIFWYFSSPEHEVLRVSYYDHSPSVGVRRSSVRPSSIHIFLFTSSICKYRPISTKLGHNVYPIRSQMSSILSQIEPEHPELFALEFGKIAEYDFFYTLLSTNINQSAPNLVKLYVIIRSRMGLIMNLIGPELSELSALELKNLPYLNLYLKSSICKY